MAVITGGRAVVESLKLQGTDLLFGIISIHNIDLLDTLYDAQGSIKYIGGRTEQGCGHMADGYARASGRPGVFLTSTGPGAANAMGSMGEAYHSSSPVLEITTNVPKELVNRRRGFTHEPKNQLEMFRSVTDWNALITEVESIPDHIDQAFRRFKTRRPRPIELEIPTDLFLQEADFEMGPPEMVEPPQGDPAMIEKAAEALGKAKRPLIYAGEEVIRCGGTDELIKLAELLSAPVVTGDGGKGAFPEDHPLCLGPALGESIWGRNPVTEFIRTCDLVLVAGSILGYKSTVLMDIQLPETLIHILMDENGFGLNYAAAIPIVANSQKALSHILSLLNDKDVDKGGPYRNEIAEMKAQIYASVKEQWPNELRTLETIRDTLPENTITCWDATVPAYRASGLFKIHQPRTFMNPIWGGLGFGFPASLGAKTAMPRTPVLCVTGDGGFQYNVQELATAAQYGITPVVLMFNDNAWGILKQRQKEQLKGRLIGTKLVNPNFVKLFESYGFEATRVRTVDEMTKSLGSAIHSNRLQLIEAQIPDGFANFR